MTAGGSLIGADQALALWAAILGGTAAVVALERRYAWADRVGGPTLALLLAASLANLRVLPPEAPAYETASSQLLPVAVALLLFRADLVRIAREARRLLAAFALCAVGTIAGAAGAVFLLTGVPQKAEVGGVLTASYIGGTVNFLATGEALGLARQQTDSLLVADNLVMVVIFVVLFAAAGHPAMRRRFRTAGVADAPQAGPGGHPFDRPIRLFPALVAVAIAALVAALADAAAPRITGWLGTALPAWLAPLELPSILGNRYVLISALAVTCATLAPGWFGRLDGGHEVGLLMIYLFLFVLGAPARVELLLSQAPGLMIFCAVVAGSNLLMALAGGWALGIELEYVLLAVNATVGGPPTAAAMAGSCGWGRLVVPGVLTGLLGYAVGTPLGVAVGRYLRTLAGSG